jgi:hypothetical protein
MATEKLTSRAPTKEMLNAAPEVQQKMEQHAEALGRTGPLGRAISVLADVLTDIADWENRALAEAVTDARNGLLTMLEVERRKREANPIPRVIQSAATQHDAAPDHELAKLREDAARYRWLRSRPLDEDEIYIAVDSDNHPNRWGLGGDDPKGCDAAIDAARKENP